MTPRAATPLLIVVLALAVLVFPWAVGSGYWLNLVNLAIGFSVACLGLNIVLGYGGQLSLAQAAFWGVGAYTTTAAHSQMRDVSLAGHGRRIHCGGPVWGAPGHSYSEAFRPLPGHGHHWLRDHPATHPDQRHWLTGGSDGIAKIPSPRIGPYEFKDPNTFFYVAAVSLILLTWASIRLKNSRVGRAFMADP